MASQGVEDTSNTTPLASNPVITEQKPTGTDDPFANQRGSEEGPFSNGGTKEHLAVEPEGPSSEKVDRRLSSDEWDASKTPPSRFQQRKGSVYATPNSRDGHVDRNLERDAKYHAKLAEKGWASKLTGRRGSKGEA